MNKKGMTTVFVTIVAGSVISLVICFVTLACREAAVSYSESVMNLAGRSVLAEFDRDLKKRYGLIAFYGQKDEARSPSAEHKVSLQMLSCPMKKVRL